VFPEFQGRGIGVDAHRQLIRVGPRYWRERYGTPVGAFDTLCDSADSKLFVQNGWKYAGRTKGFGSDRARPLVLTSDDTQLRNNVGLIATGRAWQVWVRTIRGSVLR
jgi:hypothetical protein